ncbi:hypothetical protein [Streptomyces sp. NBC_00996]|uniref:hypothetical protein n=1 Tax=Streptomyces sp. NBC_00996 TaxID=2903710 RepID=UPI00386A915D|nr:hypothetical protein OG390_21075 [Streptomyces sp. NBC_00996]
MRHTAPAARCRAWLEGNRVRNVPAIPKDEALPLPDGRTRQARELYAVVPVGAFERRSCADGAKGLRKYNWAAVHGPQGRDH